MAEILSRKSDNSRASQLSQKILDEVSYKSGTKIYSLQGLLTDDTVNSVWGSFGLYISKQLRSGRSVKIPHFGVFTFTNPDVTLPGVTNPDIRDKQLREPVFIVQKDFLNGIPIQSAIQTDQGVRPINLQGLCGNIQMIQINLLEISESANCSKENVRLSLERVFRQISIAAKKDGFVQMIIPAIGTFQYKKGLVSVTFYESLKKECKGIVKRPLDEQIQKRQRYLTAEKLRTLDQDSQQYVNNIQQQTIDGSAIDWLGKNYDFKINESTKNIKPLNDKSKLPSQKSCSISFTNESQILLNGQQPLKKMQNWMLQTNLTPIQIFDTIAIKKAKHPNFISREEQGDIIKLSKDEFISFLQKIGCPLPVAELEFIFMKLDKQNNGYVDYSIFKQEITGRDESIVFIQRSLKDLWIKLKLNFQKKNLKDLLVDPTKKLQKEDVQSFLLQMEPAIMKQDFPKIVQLLLNGQSFVESSKLATILSNTFDDLHSDLNWVQQTKRKIQQNLQQKKEGVSFLIQEFTQNDPKKSGEVDASTFKQVLKKCKIDLNQTDVNRLFKYESSNGILNYNDFIKSMEVSTTFFPPFNSRDSQNLQKLARSINSYIEQNSLNHFSFVKNLYQKENISNEDTSKIKISLFARLVFKYVNPDIKPHIIDYLSEIIDIDKDGFIDKFDLETFIQRYKNFSLNQQQKPQTIQIGDLEIDQNLLEGIDTENLPDSLKIKKKEDSNFGVHYDDEYDEDEAFGSNNKTSQFNGNPQRKIKLTEKQIDNLNGIIRKALHDRKISNYDAFNILDSNQDGFIILSEMSNLDKIIKLSQSQKEGYFCYMDNLNTGMIDYQRFLEVINKPINFKQEIKEDNWDWQFEMLEKIRKWYKTQNLDYMEAFKMVDIDFDGQIGKKDLHSFLSDILHIPQDLITETRLDRLYKLIDQHKRDSIQFGDFKKVIEDSFDINSLKDRSYFRNGTNLISSASESKLSKIRYPSTSNNNYRRQVFDEVNSQSSKSAKLDQNQKLKSSYSSSVFQSSRLNQTINDLNQGLQNLKQSSLQGIFEWKVNAKHQIGLFVSKFYTDIRTSFEIVSGHQNRLLYTKFKSWIDENRVLKGFNLTEKLLQQLFSDFDPHKKGYLSEHDWVSQLKNYDSTEMMIKEISEGIETQFSDAKEAFQTFSESGKDINFKQFCLQVFAQQPKRFKEEDLIKAWNRVAGSIGHTINFKDFKEVFFRKSSNTQQNQKDFVSPYASNQNKNIFNSTLSLISYDNAQSSTLSVIERMKKLVKSSDKVLENLFEEYDKSNSGFVTNLEFRNVMKKLNIGLSIFDIDSVLNICESKSGALINWREFCNKIKQTDSDLRLVSRAKARLEKIRKHIYQYLLSPKDAFRQYNENRSGKMTFDEFKALIIQLGQLSQSELPSLPIIKDIFEFIDIRRDGVIDIHEWMETFRKLEVDQSPIQILKKNNSSKQISKSLKIPKVVDLSKGNNIFPNPSNGQFDVQLFSWECSQQFDLVLAVIGKNRKLLLDKFKNEHKLGTITYEKAKSIIGQVLEQSNIRLSDKNFSCLIKFAEKNGELDYRFLMEVFKQRQEQIQYYPIK